VYYDITHKPFMLTKDLLEKNIKKIVREESIFDFKNALGDLTEKCLLKLTYEGEIS
jgi:hypothetical protein